MTVVDWVCISIALTHTSEWNMKYVKIIRFVYIFVVATVGFTATVYTAVEDDDMASVTIGVISGSIQRIVTLFLSLSDATAIGKMWWLNQYTYTSVATPSNHREPSWG